MAKASSTTKARVRTDPEAIERRRMQNRLAQRKRRLKRAQMAREEKERQQRFQAAQAASRLTFMNEAYMPMGQQTPLYEQQFHPAMNNYYTSTPPPFEDMFMPSPYMTPTSVPPLEANTPFLLNDYPSPSASSFVASTPPLSVYSPSLIDDDLSNDFGSGNVDLDASLLLGSDVENAPSSAPGPRRSHTIDAYGLMQLQPMSSPVLHSDRDRATSVPIHFTPPRSVPSLSTPPPTSHASHTRTHSASAMNLGEAGQKKTNCCCNNTGLNLSLNAGSQPNLSHTSGIINRKTGLHACAEQGNTHVVQQLLGYGADIDSVDEYGRTALHYAVSNNQSEVVKHLIDRGASMTIVDVNGISPMHIAAESESKEIMRTMMMASLNPGTKTINDTACFGYSEDEAAAAFHDDSWARNAVPTS